MNWCDRDTYPCIFSGAEIDLGQLADGEIKHDGGNNDDGSSMPKKVVRCMPAARKSIIAPCCKR